MFRHLPRIFAHKSILDVGNFVTYTNILHATDDPSKAEIFKRFCPHRMYPLHEPGEHVGDIHCKFHNFKWDKNGTPLNNPKKLHSGCADIGISGLIFTEFTEPDHHWVHDLAKETQLKYSHTLKGSSKGSWLWLMDAEADLLHVYKDGIHPFLAQQINVEDLVLEQGDGWILQNHPSGWWLYIFPFTFVEYGNPGMVMVNHVNPHDVNTEFGFDWMTQFYYDESVSPDRRLVFETLEQVFQQDVHAAELQKGNYFPLVKAMNSYEDHCVHFGKWYKENLIK